MIPCTILHDLSKNGSLSASVRDFTIFISGNMNPYITSYLRYEQSDTSLKYSQAMWIFAVQVMGHGMLMIFGGLIHFKIGPRLTCLLGGTVLR